MGFKNEWLTHNGHNMKPNSGQNLEQVNNVPDWHTNKYGHNIKPNKDQNPLTTQRYTKIIVLKCKSLKHEFLI